MGKKSFEDHIGCGVIILALIVLSTISTMCGYITRAVATPEAPHCRAIAPICHLGETPMCLCGSASQFSCAWQCVRQ